MNILITGGAGYIGSALVKELTKVHRAVVIDNLSTGNKKYLAENVIFYKGDLCDKEFLLNIFKNHHFDAVIHLAAYKSVAESMVNLSKYSQNILGTINLLDMIALFRLPKLIFSSSAAVYGLPKYVPIDEIHPKNPVNYYGYSKLACENIIQWYAKQKGFVAITLRYFNIAGDTGIKFVDKTAKNIFPILREAILGKRDQFSIFGNDWPTPDGTCIRDYIALGDLVRAHIQALDLTQSEIFNLGTSKGVSVLEIVKMFESVSGKRMDIKFASRREGDPPILTASSDRAGKLLNWEAKISIKEMVKSSLFVK